VIRLGIIGCNYGRAVLLPAFRADPRCEVVALAGSDAARTAALAKEAGIAKAYGRWDELVADQSLDAIAIATPPRLQPGIAVRALQSGKAVFAEKPLAADMSGAKAMLVAAQAARKPVMVDFEFAELPAWQRAKVLIDEGTIGTLRHVAVTWQVENRATLLRLKSWKTDAGDGGGALGNLVSHCFFYLEHFCGPIRDLSARTFGLPGENPPSESSVSMCGTFVSGAAYMLSMSAGSYLGSGHRIEFYGEDGTLVLWNATTDYMRGFKLFHAKRPAASLQAIAVESDNDGSPDGRIAPVSRLVSRFIDAIENGTQPAPGIAQGARVQALIDAARRSHASGGQALEVDA
jgi:predicted dehydrogenase